MARTLSVEALRALDFTKFPSVQPYPAMQFFPKEWLTGDATRAMSAEQQGGFMNLLAEAWDQKPPCSLPNDQRQLANYARLGPRWRHVGTLILSQFVECPDGRLRNPKQFAVWMDMLRVSEKRRRPHKAHPDVPTRPSQLFTPAIPDAAPDADEPDESRQKPEGVQGEPKPTPDFAVVERLSHKLESAGFTDWPTMGQQLVVAWLSSGVTEELVNETLAFEPQCSGKSYKFFQAILFNRRDNPHERPSRSRTRRTDGGSGSAGTGRKPKSYA